MMSGHISGRAWRVTYLLPDPLLVGHPDERLLQWHRPVLRSEVKQAFRRVHLAKVGARRV